MNLTLTVRAPFVSPARALVLALGLATAATTVACGGGGGGSGGGATAAGVTSRVTPTPNPTPGGGGGGTGGGSAGGGGTPIATTGPRLGMNMHFFSYYMADWPFVDVMKAGQTQSGTLNWDLLNPKGLPAPTLDADGWPKGLGDGQVVSTITCRATGGRYPGGVYTLLFEGQGEVQVGLDAAPGRYAHDGAGTASHKVTVTPSGEGIQVRITRSSAANPVRNVRLIMPGFETTYEEQPFHPMFLAKLRPFAVLRFMDWGRTNNSPVVKWSDRTPANWRSHASLRGVSWEQMIRLSNTLARDPWICIPHKANDDYVRQLATLWRDKLDPRLKLHVEYSNEVWNFGFGQFKDVENAGKAAGRTWMAQYATRAVQCFKIFEEVFGGRSRLVRVLGTHTANPWIGQQIVNATPPGAADALAVAPYFGGSLGSKQASAARGMTVDQLLAECAKDIEVQRQRVRANKAIADKAGLTLVAYEGGQHLAGVGSNAEDAQLTAKFIAANRHPRMGELYKTYLAMWKQETGGTLFCAYAFTYSPGKNGMWGALEVLSQENAPKYQALLEVANEWHGATR